MKLHIYIYAYTKILSGALMTSIFEGLFHPKQGSFWLRVYIYKDMYIYIYIKICIYIYINK